MFYYYWLGVKKIVCYILKSKVPLSLVLFNLAEKTQNLLGTVI